MGTLTGGGGEQLATGPLLRALLLELRALRTALERSGVVDFGAGHEALLAAVHSTVGEAEWTSDELIHLASTGAGAGAATLRRILSELRLCDPRALGRHLSKRVGFTAGGLELRRVGLTHKVVRWCVTCI